MPVVGGATEGQALVQHGDGGFQVPLGEVQTAQETGGEHRFDPRDSRHGVAERLLPLAPALGELPEVAQGERQPRLRLDLVVWMPHAGL
jgi:hypothetical protein